MKLINDLNATSADEMNYTELSETVRLKKQSQGDKGIMDIFEKAYQDGKIEGREEGREEGQNQEKLDIAKKMLSIGKFSLDDISETTSLPIETIKKLVV